MSSQYRHSHYKIRRWWNRLILIMEIVTWKDGLYIVISPRSLTSRTRAPLFPLMSPHCGDIYNESSLWRYICTIICQLIGLFRIIFYTETTPYDICHVLPRVHPWQHITSLWHLGLDGVISSNLSQYDFCWSSSVLAQKNGFNGNQWKLTG